MLSESEPEAPAGSHQFNFTAMIHRGKQSVTVALAPLPVVPQNIYPELHVLINNFRSLHHIFLTEDRGGNTSTKYNNTFIKQKHQIKSVLIDIIRIASEIKKYLKRQPESLCSINTSVQPGVCAFMLTSPAYR